MTTLYQGSNYHQTRRHYATVMTSKGEGKGSEGRSLCSSEALPTDIYDQAAQDHWARVNRYHNPLKVAELPLCKRCEKAAAKQGLEAPS